MATHPNPNKNIFHKLMHPNLAMIARTWIASAFLNNYIDSSHIEAMNLAPDKAHHGNTYPSRPQSLIHWQAPNIPSLSINVNHMIPINNTTHRCFTTNNHLFVLSHHHDSPLAVEQVLSSEIQTSDTDTVTMSPSPPYPVMTSDCTPMSVPHDDFQIDPHIADRVDNTPASHQTSSQSLNTT
jgi:hypothetical protein